ncbi:MAG: putative heme-binding domain-containing protein [Mariniblastus sp.]|jgi:putative heme-binding domain-containing protein
MTRSVELLLTLMLLPVLAATANAQEFQSLFNGRDLSGWAGKTEFWSVKDGAIFGQTTKDKPTKGNTFLVWQGGDVGDFVFKANVRFDGNNSGVQYRSELVGKPEDFVAKGYQADLHPKPEFFGMLYAEKWRGIVAKRFQRVVVGADGKPEVVGEVGDKNQKLVDNEWNELTIIAVGNRQIHRVNGVTTMDLTDNHPEAKRKGILALQLHAGAPMTVEFKDIELRHLKGKDAKAAIDDVVEKPGNKATPIERIKAAEGFKVELLYSVPGEKQGSWVNLCTDNKGRLLVSDQFGGLYRITPPKSGETLTAADVQPVPADIRAVNGMVWAFGALYVGVNDYEKKVPSGLYRLTDSDGDDNLDKVEMLRELEARGDHGVHAVVPTPDGKSLFLITGNNTNPTELAETSQVRQVWGEDHLLPSMPDGRGHNRGRLAPGGIIYRVDPDGENFEAYASGFRNIFDASVNRDGELFTYDADMEYDFNTPWYRPTRICHVVSGAEFGWRNGAGKRPPFYADNLPAVFDIGPGSPTGTTFGYGAKFPAKYQNALYALDWSWGKLYAVHLKPEGSSYTATKEEFLTGAPLPITDAIIHPGDGAMYFTIGGRKVQSGLYRVTYVGDESTELVDAASATNETMELRRSLEAFHGRQDPGAIEAAWPHLANSDRFIRFAARTAVEHQPVEAWAEKSLTEIDPKKQVEALLALARVAGVCPQHRNDTASDVDTAMRDKLLAAVLANDLSKLDATSQLTLQRTLQIILNRFGQPDEATVEELIAAIDPLFPSESVELNWLLCETLAGLQSPTIAAKAMALIEAAPTQEEQVQYARSIRMLKSGWTDELHTAYFEWFLKAANYRGGASFEKFIQFIREDAVASLGKAQKKSLKELLAKKPVKKSALENLGAIFEGRAETNWTLDGLSQAARTELKQRDFANGRKMFAAAACYACHRFDNQGGMTGPDLTTAGRRYSAHDLLDQVINPSKVINDQFSAVMVLTDEGLVHNGVIVNLGVKKDSSALVLNTDLTDPNQRVTINRDSIEELKISKTSPMPDGLFGRMTKDEILDLIAFLISGGDSKHEYFQK